MLYLYLTIFTILNIYCLVCFHKMNKELKSDVARTRKWCKEVIDGLSEQENRISEMISSIISDKNDNTPEDQ